MYMSAVAVPRARRRRGGHLLPARRWPARWRGAGRLAVYHSRFGTGLFAIHDDEDVAEVMGVPTFRYKLAAFALSCALAGVVGGVHALFISYVTTGETFTIAMPLTVMLMACSAARGTGPDRWSVPRDHAAALCLHRGDTR